MSEAAARRRASTALSPLNRPLTSYYLLIGTSGLLLAVGLVMVLSTSSAMQLVAGLPPYTDFAHQAVGVLAGLVVMWALSKAPVRFFRAMAYPMLIAAIIGLLLVLMFGHEVAGARRWIEVLRVFQFQPSEFAKLAFLLWGADLLARKEKLRQLDDWRMLLIPLLPGAAVISVLVLLGHDIGTTFLLLVVLLALLWVVGTPARVFACILALIIFALLLLAMTSHYAQARLAGFLNPSTNPTGSNMQSIQGKWAIGSGGLWGVGLGNSQQKWGWVPDDSTDFIFAILGEELGLIGTGCVVLLYGGLAYAGLRVARRVGDPFMRLAAAAATAWIVGQAIVNICAVIGLLPITGVPLPLISMGLSSVLATLGAVGMLLSFARCEPGAAEALAAVRARRRLRLPAVLRRDRVIAPVGAARPARPAGRAPRAGPGPARPGEASRLASPGAEPGAASRVRSGQVPARRRSTAPAGRPGTADGGSGPGRASSADRASSAGRASTAGRPGPSSGRGSGEPARPLGSGPRAAPPRGARRPAE